MQHDPTHRNHLGDGADFAAPVGFDGDLIVNEVKNADPPDDLEITENDKNDEPNREVPIDAPVDEGGDDETGHEKGFIGERVEDGSREGLLIEVSRDPPVDSIEHRGQSVNRNRQPAK